RVVQPAAVGPQHTGGVGLVRQQQGVVAPRQLDQLRERGEVAVHAEDAVGDDEPPAGGGPFAAQQLVEVVDVGVAVDVDAGAGQPAAVDQAGVVEGVAEDGVRAAGEAAHQGEVGGEAAGEDEGGLGRFPTGECAFEGAQ